MNKDSTEQSIKKVKVKNEITPKAKICKSSSNFLTIYIKVFETQSLTSLKDIVFSFWMMKFY